MSERDEERKIIRQRYCDARSCRGCEDLSWCDDCEEKFCSAYQDWHMVGVQSLCPLCKVILEKIKEDVKKRKKKEG